MNRLHCQVLVFVLALVFLGGAAPACAASPADTIRQLQGGVDNADAAQVVTYLDLDRVAGSVFDAALKNEDVLRMASEYPPLAVVIGLGGGTGGTVAREFLSTEAKQFVLYGVSSGAFAGRPKPGMTRYGGLMGALLRGGADDRKRFGDAVTRKQSGDKATVSTSLFDAGNGETYPLELGLERQNGVWRVVEISNVPKLLGRLPGTKK